MSCVVVSMLFGNDAPPPRTDTDPVCVCVCWQSAFDNPSDLLLSNGPLLDPLTMERGDGDVKRMRRE